MTTAYLASGFPVILYSFVLGIGVLVGLWLSVPEFDDLDQGLEVLLLILAGGFIGSRLVYVFSSWGYFRSNIREAISPVQGGFDWFGAFLGALLMTMLLAFLMRTNWLELLDNTALLWISLGVTLWLGTLLTGRWYGPVSDAWYAVLAVDEWGTTAPRVPLQLAGVLGAVIIGLLDKPIADSQLGRAAGMRFAVSMTGLMGIVLLLSVFRVDPSPTFNSIQVDMSYAFGVIILCGLLATYSVWKYRFKTGYIPS
jgi:prolipoprotein diacylglyceryltransferase